MKSICFHADAFEEYNRWRQVMPEIFDKINTLIFDISRDPFKGIGKPEPLKGNYAGLWSRRITQEHRLIYKVKENTIFIFKCHGHYD